MGHSQRTRDKISEAAKQSWLDPKVRAKRAKVEANRRKKISSTMKKHYENPVFKEKMVEAVKRSLCDPLIQAKRLKAVRKMARDPSRNAKIAKTSRERWKDPNYAKRVSESIRLASARPEVKAKHRRASKSMWTNQKIRDGIIVKIRQASQKASFKQKCSRASRKRWNNPEEHRKQSERLRKLWSDPHYKAECVKHMMLACIKKPNKAELKLLSVLKNVLPNEYKYVGNGEFILGGKCPDFMNKNGQKKVIELFGDYWHNGENPQGRIKHFKKYGFDTLVIWEHELKNEEILTEKIVGFNMAVPRGRHN